MAFSSSTLHFNSNMTPPQLEDQFFFRPRGGLVIGSLLYQIFQNLLKWSKWEIRLHETMLVSSISILKVWGYNGDIGVRDMLILPPNRAHSIWNRLLYFFPLGLRSWRFPKPNICFTVIDADIHGGEGKKCGAPSLWDYWTKSLLSNIDS